MKFTLKNLALLNTIFFGMFTFDLNCMKGPDLDSVPKLKRLDSTIKFPPYNNAEEKYYFPRFTFDEYFTLANAFFKANGKNDLEIKSNISEMKNKFKKIYPLLDRLQENFGSKLYFKLDFESKLYSDLLSFQVFQKIESIDATILTDKTWQAIRNWFEKYQYYIPNFEELVEDLENVIKTTKENFEFTEKKTEEIYKKIVQESPPEYNGEMGIFSKTKLFCMGTKVDDVNKIFFKDSLIKFLKSSPENFQRIMLLYFVFNMQIYADKRTMNVKDDPKQDSGQSQEDDKKNDAKCTLKYHPSENATVPVKINNKETMNIKIEELPEFLRNLPKGNIMITEPFFKAPALKVIDISFPSLMNFAVKFAKTNSPHLCKILKDPKDLKVYESWDLSHVLFIYKKFRTQINRIITGRGLDDVPDYESGLSNEEINYLTETIVGAASAQWKKLIKIFPKLEMDKIKQAKLFDVSNLDESDLEIFKKSLKKVLKNATGFQSILSLVTANTINRGASPFYDRKGPSAITILYPEDTEASCFDPDTCTVWMGKKQKDLAYTLFHETKHAYHLMINFIECNSLVEFSILNSSLFDFTDRFFPMLNRDNLTQILENIKIDDVSEKEIMEITENAINFGFGNILFKYMIGLEEDEIKISNLIKNKEFVQTCVCVKELLLHPRWANDARWLHNEEMFAMQGYFPVITWNGKVIVIIVDNQNDQMFNIREFNIRERETEYRISFLGNTGNFENIINFIDGETFAFHNSISKSTAAKINSMLNFNKIKPGKSKYQYINVNDLNKGPTVEEVFKANGISIE